MTEITNLFSWYAYPYRGTNLPIVVLVSGWNGDADAIDKATLQRIANYGLFVVNPGMRGRNNASGSRDASGREIYDLADAVYYIRNAYPNIVSASKAAIVGYSGGGGNALASACKFPDLWNVVVSHFGMSDYGRDAVNGWYQNNSGAYTASIAASIGGTPSEYPNRYFARDATIAITNFSGGYLYTFHQATDITVPLIHSTRIKNALDGAGLSNYSYNVNDAYVHGYPVDNPGLVAVEPTWSAKILSQAAWTVPASGTLTVIGYCKTKRFEIRLNTNGTTSFGIDATVTVIYNTATDTYTVTPLTTGGIDVAITQGAKTGSATNISGETTITVT